MTLRPGTYFPYAQRASPEVAGLPWFADFQYQFINAGVFGDGVGVTAPPAQFLAHTLCKVQQSTTEGQQLTLLGPTVDGVIRFRQVTLPIDLAEHRLTCGWNGVELYLNVDGQRILTTYIHELNPIILDALVEEGIILFMGNASECCVATAQNRYNPISIDRATLSLGPSI